MACGNGMVSRYGSDQTSQPTTASLQAGMYDKLKLDAISGKVSRFKARVIAQGFKMQQDVDYKDTFSSTLGSTATRTVISIGNAEDLEIHSVDFTP